MEMCMLFTAWIERVEDDSHKRRRRGEVATVGGDDTRWWWRPTGRTGRLAS
jgi:hypothetical protein